MGASARVVPEKVPGKCWDGSASSEEGDFAPPPPPPQFQKKETRTNIGSERRLLPPLKREMFGRVHFFHFCGCWDVSCAGMFVRVHFFQFPIQNV